MLRSSEQITPEQKLTRGVSTLLQTLSQALKVPNRLNATYPTIGRRVELLRVHCELTQAESAELFKNERKLWSRLESGKHQLSFPFLSDLCMTFGVSSDWIIGRAYYPFSLNALQTQYTSSDSLREDISNDMPEFINYLQDNRESLESANSRYIHTVQSWDRYMNSGAKSAIVPNDFPGKLILLQESQNLPSQKLATIIGVNRKQIFRYRESQLPMSNNLIAIADYFGVSTDFLLYDHYEYPIMRADLWIAHEAGIIQD